MNKERYALNNIIPHLNDMTFENFAGLFNKQRLSGPVEPAEEINILRYVLNEEYHKTKDPEILYIVELLDQYLSKGKRQPIKAIRGKIKP